jgi:hypothetical protein
MFHSPTEHSSGDSSGAVAGVAGVAGGMRRGGHGPWSSCAIFFIIRSCERIQCHLESDSRRSACQGLGERGGGHGPCSSYAALPPPAPAVVRLGASGRLACVHEQVTNRGAIFSARDFLRSYLDDNQGHCRSSLSHFSRPCDFSGVSEPSPPGRRGHR